ncbi:hypothetical protein ABIB37_001231 [Agrococcus sp. UYP10]|uniref:hypothetical protein n=1 Tax=Agrococcus sp. UYP10 TaxID=1756355 RepID=UPI0033975F64
MRFVRSRLSAPESAEIEEVDALASALHEYLTQSVVHLAQTHVHGAGSSAIQSLVGKHLLSSAQFETESVVLAGPSITARPRADFYGRLSPGRGIVVEVERGGATTNNHDLKDIWKTHLAENAHHLFLIVPKANFRADGSARERPYSVVVRRLAAFFGDPRREIDVLTAHVFGY